MKILKKNLSSLAIIILLSLLSGCIFESVNQPKSAQPGETIDIALSITSTIVPEPNAHKGLLGIVVPDDWEFVSAEYNSVLGSGSLSPTETWRDSINKYYPTGMFGNGMKWIVLISDTGYSYQSVTTFDVDLQLKVGQTEGCFNIGYLTSKAEAGLVSSGNNTWIPISYPHKIGIPDSNLCSGGFETRRAEDWDNLFDRTSGWTGADGVYTIPLNEYEAADNTPAGKQLFLFSDTFIGEVDASNRRVNSKLINNTLALMQSGLPVPDETEFFWKVDSLGNPATVFVPNTPEADPGDWYWLMDGISINDTIYVFALRLNSTGGGGVFSFEANGVALLKFTLDEQNFISAVQQFDTPLFYKNSNDNTELVLGQAIMPMTGISGNPSPDGYIYVYGPKSSSSGKQLSAAKVLPNEIEDFSKWKYWNGTDWTNNIEECADITSGISQEFSVSPFGDDEFLLVYQMGNSVAVKIGESPVGPFGIFQMVYDCPEVLINSNVFVYNAKAHPNVSDEEDLLISYNVNTFDLGDLINNADIYRPRFIYLKVKDSTTTSIDNEFEPVNDLLLNQNYPNPFNPSTQIDFFIPAEINEKVSLKVYDILGKEVVTLIDKKLNPGKHSASFDISGSNGSIASGVYFYTLTAASKRVSKKMIFLK